MLLAIDAGNTSIKFALFADRDVVTTWDLPSATSLTPNNFVAPLAARLSEHGVGLDALDDAVMSSVVPPLAVNLDALCVSTMNKHPLTVTHETRTGLRLLMDNPAGVGADRIVNCAAAHRLHAGPLVVVDFGTATTFDVVSGDGGFSGGVIAPGVEIVAEALTQRAAKLPPIDLAFPHQVVGRNTVHAMQSGVMLGYLGLVEGILARIATETAEAATVIATGGRSRAFIVHTNAINVHEPHLTLRGLQMIWELNH